MTIAACYLSAEGVVFGADSTTTMFVPGPGMLGIGTEHHYNYAQKIFQIGQTKIQHDSTLAITMWGMGSLGQTSYRTLIAQFADSLVAEEAESMREVADRWNEFFWKEYSDKLAWALQLVQRLLGQATRTKEDESALECSLQTFSGGFCIGGNLPNDRTPSAFEIRYAPTLTAAKPVDPLPIGSVRFWGCPNLIDRLIFGLDRAVLSSIRESEKWLGTDEELRVLVAPHCLGQPRDLPIREAIDWIYASIYTTIKTMKFSHMAPVCGGPIEIAVITTDRPFRWVRHKEFDAAIEEGGLL